MPATVRVGSWSASTIAQSLPPISTVDGMPRSAQRIATWRPVVGEPVNAHASMPASISAAPCAPPPITVAIRFGGSSAARPSISHFVVSGVYSDGLTTTPLPHSSDGYTARYSPAIGKFHGAITPITPRATSSVCPRLPGNATGFIHARFGFSAGSTTRIHCCSMSRWPMPSSHSASTSSLPTSSRASAITSARRASIERAARSSASARSRNGRSFHDRWASRARVTAARMSSSVERVTGGSARRSSGHVRDSDVLDDGSGVIDDSSWVMAASYHEPSRLLGSRVGCAAMDLMRAVAVVTLVASCGGQEIAERGGDEPAKPTSRSPPTSSARRPRRSAC